MDGISICGDKTKQVLQFATAPKASSSINKQSRDTACQREKPQREEEDEEEKRYIFYQMSQTPITVVPS